MIGQLIVVGGLFQGMSDRCFVCEAGNPIKDIPVESLNLGKARKAEHG